MVRRLGWPIGLAILVIAMLGGCAQQQTTDTGGGQTETKVTVPQAIDQKAGQPVPGASPGAAAPQAAAPKAAGSPVTAASPVAQAQRGEPQGRMVYGWHTAISPSWLDPLENPALITPYAFQYALHDAVIKHMPGQPFSPSLAESYQIAPDYRSATIKLRDGITFHDGSPITSEDVKFTYENYKGANATILREKTQSIETPDPRTVNFTFKEPFLDFLMLYGSPATGAGWVVPKAYYEQVGPDGFKNNPIGAGPYKFVRQAPGTEIELEAFTDYWRKTPAVKTLIIRGIAEATTRAAQLQTGEVDLINLIPGELIETVRADQNMTLGATLCCSFWLEFPRFEDADSPFNKRQVREAISLALDREALSQAETAGLSPLEGNWISQDWPGAIQAPPPPYDPERAQQLMAEAGFPNGFDVEDFTPWPPYFSLGERIVTQLRAINVRIGRLNTMERGAAQAKLGEGREAFRGIFMNVSGAPGDAAVRIRTFATCNGSASRICLPEIDQKFAQYEASTDPQERERLLTEIQQFMIDQHIFVPVYRLAFTVAQGPRIANPTQEIWGSIPQYIYVGPYEDIQLKQ